MRHDVKDLRLAKAGQQRIEWAGNQMPVLDQIRRRFLKEIGRASCRERV